MKIISWNINGIRSNYEKIGKKFLTPQYAEIFCLQEIKAQIDQVPTALKESFKHIYIHSAQKKGYSGVALLSKERPIQVTLGLGVKKFDSEGRVIIAEYKTFILMNCYFPNGQRDHKRVPYKLEFYRTLLKKIHKLEQKHKKPIILCGDLNTAHKEMDLANPKANIKTTGFLTIERETLDTYFQYGLIDCFRFFHKNQKSAFTWWTYRNNCRERNIGWRIDYFLVTSKLIKKIKKCMHLTDVMGSDHCPLLLELKS
jgi:exodeoxyribonuclease-3